MSSCLSENATNIDQKIQFKRSRLSNVKYEKVNRNSSLDTNLQHWYFLIYFIWQNQSDTAPPTKGRVLGMIEM